MYYNLRRMPDGYRMAKFDKLFALDAVYNIKFSRGRFSCDCPASNKPNCKHREMIPTFVTSRKVDTGYFLCYDTGDWHPPVEGLTPEDITRKAELSRPKRRDTRRAVQQRKRAGIA